MVLSNYVYDTIEHKRKDTINEIALLLRFFFNFSTNILASVFNYALFSILRASFG